MAVLRIGTWLSIAWGSNHGRGDGTSVYVELECRLGDGSWTLPELRSAGRWAEQRLRERYDHREIDPEVVDLGEWAPRIASALGPELKALNLALCAINICEQNLWSFRYEVADA